MSFIARLLETNRLHHGGLEAIRWGDEAISWRELAARASSLADGLFARGLEVGDRVAVISENQPEVIETFYAAAVSGIVAAPVTTRSHPRELDRYYGEIIRPRAAILGPGAAPCVGPWLDACEVVVSLDGGPAGEPYADVLGAAGSIRDDLDPDAPFTIGQTSGTTGTAKGAVITQRAAHAAILRFVAEVSLEEDDTYLIQHPMANVPGGAGILFPLLKAARTALTSGFDARNCLELIDRHRVTHTVLVPTMLHDVLRLPDRDRYDCSSLRTVVVGAAPVPRRMLEEAIEAFGPVFLPLYGMTESVAVGCALRRADLYPLDAHPPERLLSIGTPSAGVEVRVLRDDGTTVTPNGEETGEVALRGENVVTRYWGDVPENETSWRDGWFLTGDVATVDVDGFLRLVDRKKDVIISGGTNVASREVEEVLLRHPAVEAVAVVGVPHERWGEAVTAVVILRDGASCGEQELVAHARESLGAPKVPKRVLFTDVLPTNVMGKVLKRELRAQLAADA